VIKGRRRRVKAGHAIAMRGDDPHRLLNETHELGRAIWFVSNEDVILGSAVADNFEP
jgi:hypothetical protein